MLIEFLVAVFFVLLLGFAIWALFGLFLMPVFAGDTLALHFAHGDGESLEQRIRAYGWFREGKKNGGRLVIVDCGLTQQGLELAQKFCAERQWLDYCPNQTLTDYIELMQCLLENGSEI